MTSKKEMFNDIEKSIEAVPMNMEDYDSLSRKVSQLRVGLSELESAKKHIDKSIKGKQADLDDVLKMVQTKKITKEVDARWFLDFKNEVKVRQWIKDGGEVVELYKEPLTDADRQLKLGVTTEEPVEEAPKKEKKKREPETTAEKLSSFKNAMKPDEEEEVPEEAEEVEEVVEEEEEGTAEGEAQEAEAEGEFDFDENEEEESII